MPAVLAGSLYADAIAVDGGGNVFLAGGRNGFAMTSLYRVTPDGMIAIYYVTPTNWTAIDSLSTDAAGNLYVLAETPAPLVVKIAPDRGKTGPYRTPPGWLSIPKPRSNLANLYE
jgi:sugar lactone lactonase YvrE